MNGRKKEIATDFCTGNSSTIWLVSRLDRPGEQIAMILSTSGSKFSYPIWRETTGWLSATQSARPVVSFQRISRRVGADETEIHPNSIPASSLSDKGEGTADSAAADGLHSGTFYSKFFSGAYPHLHFGRNLEAGETVACARLLLGRPVCTEPSPFGG